MGNNFIPLMFVQSSLTNGVACSVVYTSKISNAINYGSRLPIINERSVNEWNKELPNANECNQHRIHLEYLANECEQSMIRVRSHQTIGCCCRLDIIVDISIREWELTNDTVSCGPVSLVIYIFMFAPRTHSQPNNERPRTNISNNNRLTTLVFCSTIRTVFGNV